VKLTQPLYPDVQHSAYRIHSHTLPIPPNTTSHGASINKDLTAAAPIARDSHTVCDGAQSPGCGHSPVRFTVHHCTPHSKTGEMS